MMQMKDDTDLSDRADYRKSSSIFSIICNHLNNTKRKQTKQLSNTQQKNRKLQLFGWSHVDDADDTDDTDRSVTDNRQQQTDD